MGVLHQRTAGPHLSVIDHLIDGVDRPHRNAGGQQHRFPLFVGPGQKRFLQRGHQRQPVRVAPGVRHVSRVVDHLREADERAERPPQLVAADADRDVARFGVKRLIRQQRAVRRAERAGHDAIGEVSADHAGEDAELALEHRHVDELAAAGLLPGVERREDPERRVHPGGDVRDRHAGAHARSPGFAGDADHPALGLHHEVERGAIAIRAVLAESRNGAVDDAGLAFARARVIDAELRHRADAQVLEHDVRALQQPEEQRFALGMLQVERDALFIAIQVDEVGRFVAVEGRTPRARDFAVERLDLDDLRAIVAEHRRGEGAGQRVREIEYRDVVERQHRPMTIYAFRTAAGS